MAHTPSLFWNTLFVWCYLLGLAHRGQHIGQWRGVCHCFHETALSRLEVRVFWYRHALPHASGRWWLAGRRWPRWVEGYQWETQPTVDAQGLSKPAGGARNVRSVRRAHLAWIHFHWIPQRLVPGELGLESGLPSPTAPYCLRCRVGADIVVEVPLPGRLSMRKCLPMRMGCTLEGHSHPQRLWFGDGKLGFIPRALVPEDTRVVTLYEHSDVPSLPWCCPHGWVAVPGVHSLEK